MAGDSITGKPTEDQLTQYRSMDVKIRAQALYLYLFEGLSMSKVNERMARITDDRTVSLITRCNGFYILGAKSYEDSRYNKKMGTKDKPLETPDGISVRGPLDLKESDFVEFVRMHPYGEDDYRIMDRFMVGKHLERHPELVPGGERVSTNKEPAPRLSGSKNAGGSIAGTGDGFSGGAAVAAVIGIVGIIAIIVVVKFIGGFVTHNFGYYLDKFDYASYTYIGNKNFGSPKGLGMRFKGLNGEAYDIGYMEKKNVSGECILYDGKGTLVAGTAKKNKANGWCVEENRDTGHVHLTKFKKGNKSGYGVCYYNGTSNLVQFTKDGEKEIAEYTSNNFVKSNGKTYNASKKLKKVEIKSGTEFVIDGATINLYNNAFSYEKGKCKMSGNHSGVDFENEIDVNIFLAVQYYVGQSLEILEINMDTMQTLGQFTAQAQ